MISAWPARRLRTKLWNGTNRYIVADNSALIEYKTQVVAERGYEGGYNAGHGRDVSPKAGDPHTAAVGQSIRKWP